MQNDVQTLDSQFVLAVASLRCHDYFDNPTCASLAQVSKQVYKALSIGADLSRTTIKDKTVAWVELICSECYGSKCACRNTPKYRGMLCRKNIDGDQRIDLRRLPSLHAKMNGKPYFAENDSAVCVLGGIPCISFASAYSEQTCEYSLLDGEVQNRIAEYLRFPDRETDEEFSERVKNGKDVPESEEKAYLEVSPQMPNPLYHMILPSFVKKSATKKKVLVMQGKAQFRPSFLPEFSVSIIDTETNTLMHNSPVSQSDAKRWCVSLECMKIALSSNMSHYAIFSRKCDAIYKNILCVSIRNLRTKEEKEHILATNNNIEAVSAELDFNKQLTQIYAYITALSDTGIKQVGMNIGFAYIVQTPYIIPLVSEKEHQEKSIKTLADYFYLYRICQHKKVAKNS